ncbi:glutathione S-transferase [Planifilum fimeticola]|uniref:Glutathione S-transferase n=1 Tax=Planifilum fimeticola TaxID=201975 RepID=A0A2T0LAI0_9BACL|nr:VOC family protein [Planifilum fimeticola]PRX38836.1 glutathione S-transferase [Planifilum fimeticola]
MIKGLYEVHFQVEQLDRSIAFYEKLGLTLAWKTEGIAFMWIEPEKSWLGLWEKPRGNHVFAKHLAFRVDFEDMPGAIDWLKKRGIQPEKDGKFEPIEPVVRPDQRNASVYFSDPDGHRLELICPVPGDAPKELPKMYWSEWQRHRSSL